MYLYFHVPRTRVEHKDIPNHITAGLISGFDFDSNEFKCQVYATLTCLNRHFLFTLALFLFDIFFCSILISQYFNVVATVDVI